MSKLSAYKLHTTELIEKIELGKSYKKELKSKEKKLKEITNQINSILKNINLIETKSKYKNFPARKKYTEFTGINLNFFKNIE